MTAVLEPPATAERPLPVTAAPPVAPEPAPRQWLSADEVRRIGRAGLLTLTLFVAGFVAYLLFLSALPYARAQAGLEDRFSYELEWSLAPVNQPIATGAPVAVLTIPAIDVHEIVVEGSTSTELMRGPGRLPSSALPGQPGTSIILGRKQAFGGPFRDLHTLEQGEQIALTTGAGEVTYTIERVGRLDGTDPTGFAANGNRLVLVTMDEPMFGSGRLFVEAVPDTAPQAQGTRVPSGPPQLDELGLAGDRDAAGVLLVWVQVLLVLALGTVVLFKRMKRGPAWLLAVPPLMLATWLVYENLARLLPATL